MKNVFFWQTLYHQARNLYTICLPNIKRNKDDNIHNRETQIYRQNHLAKYQMKLNKRNDKVIYALDTKDLRKKLS